MSANSHTICPKCYPDITTFCSTQKKKGPYVEPTATDHAVEELGYDTDVRENYHTYITATDGILVLHHDYSALCWTCGWHFETEMSAPIPPVKS